MELKNVKLVEKHGVESGTSKAGKPWKKQLFIVEELDSQYPKTVALTAWNDTVDKLAEKADGSAVNCALRIESREYNGRWYTDAICYQIHSAGDKSSTTKKAEEKQEAPNDLPF